MNMRTFVTILSRKPQNNFPKMRGGSTAVWNFSENSSVLEALSFPKLEIKVKIPHRHQFVTLELRAPNLFVDCLLLGHISVPDFPA